MNTLYKCYPHDNTGDIVTSIHIRESRPKIRELARDTAWLQTWICPIWALNCATWHIWFCPILTLFYSRNVSRWSHGAMCRWFYTTQTGGSRSPDTLAAVTSVTSRITLGNGTCVRHGRGGIGFLGPLSALAAHLCLPMALSSESENPCPAYRSQVLREY